MLRLGCHFSPSTPIAMKHKSSVSLTSLQHSLNFRLESSHSQFMGPKPVLVFLGLHGKTCGWGRRAVQLQAVSTGSSVRPYNKDSYAGYGNGEGGGNPRVFVPYTIYKGKGALSIRPIHPQFRPTTGGMKLHKEGSLMLEFAPSIGTRQYDWEKKQIFSLSVAEMGILVALSADEKASFFHDPHKGRVDEGRVRKTLAVDPSPDGFYFNFSIKDDIRGIQERLGVPIQKAEFAVLKNVMNYIMPCLMGWNVFVNPSMLDASMRFDSEKASGRPFMASNPNSRQF